MQRPGRVAIAVVAAVAAVLLVAGWRSVFIGGRHLSGDRSYECLHSPWHTTLHPMQDPPDEFAPLGDLCNDDARHVVVGWAIADGAALAVLGATVLGVRRRHRRRTLQLTPPS